MQWLLEICWLVVRMTFLMSVAEMLIGDETWMTGLRAVCILSMLVGLREEILKALAIG